MYQLPFCIFAIPHNSIRAAPKRQAVVKGNQAGIDIKPAYEGSDFGSSGNVKSITRG